MDKVKMMVIVEEEGAGAFRVRRTKNYAWPIADGKVTGILVTKETLDKLREEGVDVVIDPPGYKRRWTP